jgi:ribosome-binding factor A
VPSKLYRDERLSATIRDELSNHILRTFEFPGAIVTLTVVELSPKRDAAHVHLSVLPDERAPEVLQTLGAASRSLKYFLMKRLRIRVIPDVFFHLDRGPQNAAMVEKVLHESRLSEEEGAS